MNTIETMTIYLIIDSKTNEIIKVTLFKEIADLYCTDGYLILEVVSKVTHGKGMLSYDYNDLRRQAEAMLDLSIGYSDKLTWLIIEDVCYR